jgi:hypothetical protein
VFSPTPLALAHAPAPNRRPRRRAIPLLSAVVLTVIAATALTLGMNAVSNRAVPVSATLALRTGRSSRLGFPGLPSRLPPGVTVGTVSGRDGNTVTVVTASGGLDQLTLTEGTSVAALVDGDPALAVSGSHLSVEGSSTGGILSADSASLDPKGQPAGWTYPSSVSASSISIESGIVLDNVNGFVTLETASGLGTVWIGLARITTVVPASAVDVRPGSQLVAYGNRAVDGTLAPSIIDLLLKP